jgi:hypothetical protein
VVRKAHRIKPIRIGIGDKGYDDEKNHELLRDELHAMSIIPARYQDVPVWRTHSIYRKKMKRGYSKKRYHERSKDETIFSVVKRTMGDEVRSIRTRAQNNAMRFRVIAYNAARITSLAYSLLRGFLQSLRSPRKSILVYNKASSQRPHATILNERLMLQNLNRIEGTGECCIISVATEI